MSKHLPIQVRSDGRPRGEARASDLGDAVAIAEHSRKRHDRNFHGVWAQSYPGARFERKRLIRMSQSG
jgi:hypothetical protein